MSFIRTLKVAGFCLGAWLLGPNAQAMGTGTSLLNSDILVSFYDNFGIIDSQTVIVGPGEEITNWLATDGNGFSVSASISINLGGITISIKSPNERGLSFVNPLFLSFTDINDSLAPFDNETLLTPEITNVSWILPNPDPLPAIDVNADNIIVDLSGLQLPMRSTNNGLIINIAFDSTITPPPTDVPEPGLPALLGLGAALAAWNRRRR